MPLGSTIGFTGVDPFTGSPKPVTNALTNFGWEYVWHCHLLGHEENDMMRPLVLRPSVSDFNGDTLSDLAGLTSGGQIFYTTDLLNWTHTPGGLAQMVAGDFNADGRADLAGLTSGGQIFYTTNLLNWDNFPGNLSTLVIGDFNGDGHSDLAGLTSAGHIYYTTDLQNWIHVPGVLSELVE